MNSEQIKPKPVADRDNLDLLELVCQLGGRLGMFPSEEMHNAFWEARKEMEQRLSAATPAKDDDGRCSICGGTLVLIRGRYPKEDKRHVCPTCNTERLEQINEISSKTYGVAMQEIKINPIIT